MSTLEFIASQAALAGVYLTSRKLSLGWITGALGSVLYAILFIEGKLYAEGALQLIYAALGIRGWLLWKYEKNIQMLPVKHLPWSTFLQGSSIILILTIGIGWLLSRYSDTDVPWLDAFLAAAGFMVTMWMMLRYLENWLFWIGIDIASAVLYFSRNMPIAAFVYLVFTALAVYGYVQWKNDISRD